MAACSPAGRRVGRPLPTSPEVVAERAQDRRRGADSCRSSSTTTSGHSACSAAAHRSARPPVPEPRPQDEPRQGAEQHRGCGEARCRAQDPAGPSVPTPREQRPAGQGAERHRGRRGVRARRPGRRQGVRRHQERGHPAECQDRAAGHGHRPQRRGGDDVAEAHAEQREGHHQPVRGTNRGEIADRAPHRVVGVRAQRGGHRPAADQQQGREQGGQDAPAGHGGHGRHARRLPGRAGPAPVGRDGSAGCQGVAGEVSAEPDRAAGSSRLGIRRSARDSPRPTRTRTSESRTTGLQPPAPQAVPATPPNTDDPR